MTNLESDLHPAPTPFVGDRSAAMGVLVDTIEHLSSARSATDIAAAVRSGARRLTGADGVAVVLRDGGHCHYVDEDSIAPLWKGSRFPMNVCISGWAMLNGKTVVVPDIYQDDRIPHDAYRPTYVKSLVMTPVRPSDPVAAIGAYWAIERTPCDWEIEALQAVARATATAFENVRLIASLEEAAERREFLINELDHRVKNTLASVQAIVRQSVKGKEGSAALEEALGRRLGALSRVHDLLTRGSWEAAGLDVLVPVALEPYAPSEPGRLAISGPSITLKPEAAITLAMGINELATNALKYGAWSGDAGQVDVTWSVAVADHGPVLNLEWRESGGPAIAAQPELGVGTELVTRAVPRTLGGQGILEFLPQGVRYRLSAPVSGRMALS